MTAEQLAKPCNAESAGSARQLGCMADAVEQCAKANAELARENDRLKAELADLRASVNAKYWDGIREDNLRLEAELAEARERIRHFESTRVLDDAIARIFVLEARAKIDGGNLDVKDRKIADLEAKLAARETADAQRPKVTGDDLMVLKSLAYIDREKPHVRRAWSRAIAFIESFGANFAGGANAKLTFHSLQEQQKPWVKHNFGERPTVWPLLGLVEELGELCHSVLKDWQGIRTNEDHTAAAKDAIGDLVIFLSDYCSSRCFDLQQIVEDTWAKVQKRDWKADPKNGVSQGPDPSPPAANRRAECPECAVLRTQRDTTNDILSEANRQHAEALRCDVTAGQLRILRGITQENRDSMPIEMNDAEIEAVTAAVAFITNFAGGADAKIGSVGYHDVDEFYREEDAAQRPTGLSTGGHSNGFCTWSEPGPAAAESEIKP